MIIQCNSCSRKFVVKDIDIPKEGRAVQCGYCSVSWHQMPDQLTKEVPKKLKLKETAEVDDSPSVDKIKASDGKTYRFLGSQWAELLPSGKTGLFARRKISQELDEITGRKQKKVIKKRQKKIEEVDPSKGINAEKKLDNINYKSKGGLGFFGFVFLLIIVGFSIVGVLKAFENDLLNYFPNTEYVFIFMDEQLVYVAETVKNIIVIITDLINSY
tara:strand:+ start:205 stop:849 length:645 start_codon:yes stop_codon:yes gene_type:complete